jgi:hypothetical protein
MSITEIVPAVGAEIIRVDNKKKKRNQGYDP